MLCGAALRLTQYFANSSLWIDEAALARNILTRSWSGLLQPLGYAQAAPPGMLLTEKAIIAVAGGSEFALRLFPLACGLASLLLFRRVSEAVLTRWTSTYAIGLFSLGVPFVYFSSQLKQYSSDVAATLALLLAALRLRERGTATRSALLLAATGATVCWISHAAVIVMAAIGGALVMMAVLERDRVAAKRLGFTLAIWTIFAMAATRHALSAVSEADRDYLRAFWRLGFMPFPPRSAADWAWPLERVTLVFGAFQEGVGPTNGGLGYRWSALFTIVMLVGLWRFWRKRRDVALFVLFPLALVVLLSAAGIYPFAARLILFIVPGLLIATAEGAREILENLPRRLAFLSPAALAILGGAPLLAIATTLPPVTFEHLRPIVEYVHQSGRAGDTIFIYHGAALGFRYYAPRYGIDPGAVVFARCELEPRAYLHQLDRVRGRHRVWLLMTHVRNAARRNLLLGYLDQIGRRRDEIVIPGTTGGEIANAYAYLYDLSETRESSAVTADTYGPIPQEPSSSQWGCYGTNSTEGTESAG